MILNNKVKISTIKFQTKRLFESDQFTFFYITDAKCLKFLMLLPIILTVIKAKLFSVHVLAYQSTCTIQCKLFYERIKKTVLYHTKTYLYYFMIIIFSMLDLHISTSIGIPIRIEIDSRQSFNKLRSAVTDFWRNTPSIEGLLTCQ